MKGLRLLGWNPMSLVGYRMHEVSRQISNFDIAIFAGTARVKHDVQGDVYHTQSHFHYSFGFPRGGNRSCGISFMLRKSRFDEKKITSVLSPHDDPLIDGRVAMLRIKNGREDIALVGAYFPPKPQGALQCKQYWQICNSMIAWLNAQLQHLPERCLCLTFGDHNDDFGKAKHSNQGFVPVKSQSVGDARVGCERFVGSSFRQLCDFFSFGICSTWWKTLPTYRGHGHRTFLDYWTVPLMHIREVQTYKCMPNIAAMLRSCNSRTDDHLPVMLFMFHHLVTTQKRFQWDRNALVNAMNDLKCPRRRGFLMAIKEDLEDQKQKETWRDKWTETIIDPMWQMLNEQIVLKRARDFFQLVAHRDDFYVEIEKERNVLIDRKFHLLEHFFVMQEYGIQPHIDGSSLFSSLHAAVRFVRKDIQVCVDQLKALRKQHRDKISEHVSNEIEHASKSGDFALAWRLSRQLTSRFIGKQKRMYRVLRVSRPCSWEWQRFLSQPGHSGGMQTTVVDFEQILLDRNAEPPFFFDLTKELKVLARDDVKGIRHSIRKQKRRTAVPDWAAPCEIWWLLFHPNFISNVRLVPRVKAGIGSSEKPPEIDLSVFHFYMFSLCVAIRRRRRVPLQWNLSAAAQIPKPGKHRDPDPCKRDRLIHVLDVVGKGFFAYLVRKKLDSPGAPSFANFTHGYLKHHRREDAISAMKIVKSRLTAAQMSHSLSLLDLSNAFGSVSHEHMTENLSSIVCPEDFDIAQTRFTDVFFKVDSPDTCMCFSPGCGGLQGDMFMVFLWLVCFAPVVGRWNILVSQDCQLARCCIVRGPQAILSDTSLAVFADDVAKILVFQGPYEHRAVTSDHAWDKIRSAHTLFDDGLKLAGIAQNKQKAEVLPTFVGLGSFSSYKKILLEPTARRHARHLGGIQEYSLSNAKEVAARIRGMWAILFLLGLFWSRCRVPRMKRLIFFLTLSIVHLQALKVLFSVTGSIHKSMLHFSRWPGKQWANLPQTIVRMIVINKYGAHFPMMKSL